MKLLDTYLTVSLCTVIMIISVSMKLRESHRMRTATVLGLATLTGALWPLLAVAALQAGGVLVLAKGLGMVRSQPKGRALPPVDVRLTAKSAA
jgi:hypothetical protein